MGKEVREIKVSGFLKGKGEVLGAKRKEEKDPINLKKEKETFCNSIKKGCDMHPFSFFINYPFLVGLEVRRGI